ncbi:radical SAM protein [Faecalispora anaeroviscerum]|uniref:radical SAM protein n=1 Tax=Faecalispora anaeroviscerum TaxID=2991836 RepID=UPI0024B9DD2A|nr:radical SAM protein [Faecalispora anaeroviscerum]
MTLEECTLCPRRCGVRREPSKGGGFCHMGSHPVVARAALHFWEEPCISGTRGSGTVFFTGCTLGCVFCQNYDISTRREVGQELTVTQLAEVFQRLVEQGAHNINLVSPTQFAQPIAEALKLQKLPVPVVYNSSGYETVETLKMLEGLVDVYLPDLKYVSSEIAARYSGAADYPDYAKRAILEMVRQTGEARFDEQGLLVKGTVVRHLILPGHTRESIAVLGWLKEHLPTGVPVSLMAQYVPCGKAEQYPEINRPITAREFHKVEEYLMECGLDGFVQERSSAQKTYIPPFHLEGLEFLSESE